MQNLMHDIAVLELKGSAKISDKVSPVCLPTEEPSPGTKCFITGSVSYKRILSINMYYKKMYSYNVSVLSEN